MRQREAALDSDDTIRSVNISLKLKQGTIQVRAVIVQVETERTLP